MPVPFREEWASTWVRQDQHGARKYLDGCGVDPRACELRLIAHGPVLRRPKVETETFIAAGATPSPR